MTWHNRASHRSRDRCEATGQTSIDDTTAITLRELERTAAVNKSLFEDFLQRAKISQEQSTFEVRDARVITPALPPGGPSYPNKSRSLTLALGLGLLLGVGGAALKEMLNAGFVTQKQVEDSLGLPLLASISRMEARDLTVNGKLVPIPQYPAVKPLSRYSESMRTLRSGIQMTDVDNPPKIIALTSTMPGEGKTTIALSLAASAASSGIKVLLVDADLRHPSASRFLGLHKETGLVDLLLGQVKVNEVVRFVEEISGYWVLPPGTRRRTRRTFSIGAHRTDWSRVQSIIRSYRHRHPARRSGDRSRWWSPSSATRSCSSCGGDRRDARWSSIASRNCRATGRSPASCSINSMTGTPRNMANTPIITALAITKLLQRIAEVPTKAVRTLTAITLLGLCAFAMWRGWTIVHYSVVKAGLTTTGASAEAPASLDQRPGRSRRGLGGGGNPGRRSWRLMGQKRVDELSAILAVRPMSRKNGWRSPG